MYADSLVASDDEYDPLTLGGDLDPISAIESEFLQPQSDTRMTV